MKNRHGQKDMPRNARFWTFENNAWVKLTIKPGQRLVWGKSCATDEGHSFEGNTWEHTGAGVLNDWTNGGRDCDGFIQHTGTLFADIDQLAAVLAYESDTGEHIVDGRHISRPKWEKIGDCRCFDQYAQAAGY